MFGDTKERQHVTETKHIPSSLLGRCVGEEMRACVRECVMTRDSHVTYGHNASKTKNFYIFLLPTLAWRQQSPFVSEQ